MKTHIILAIGTIMILASCSSPKAQKFMGLNGSLERIKDSKYEAVEKFGEAQQGDLDEVIIYEFDKNGNNTKYATYNHWGDCLFSSKFTYENGECVLQETKNSYSGNYKTELISRQGNVRIFEQASEQDTVKIEETTSKRYLCFNTYASDYKMKEEVWTDNKNNVIERKVTRDEVIVYWVKSKFEGNNEVKAEYLDENNKGIWTYSYGDYDKKRNWTKKISYKDGVLESVTIREITYREQ